MTPTLPCNLNMHKEAVKQCSPIINAKFGTGMFANCSGLGSELDEMYEDCVFDTCINSTFYCNAFTDLVHQCQVKGWMYFFNNGFDLFQQRISGTIIGGWREKIACPLRCPENQTYSDCVSGCQPTCSNMTTSLECTEPCFEGCACIDGMIRDATGINCISQEDCKSTDSNRDACANPSLCKNDSASTTTVADTVDSTSEQDT